MQFRSICLTAFMVGFSIQGSVVSAQSNSQDVVGPAAPAAESGSSPVAAPVVNPAQRKKDTNQETMTLPIPKKIGFRAVEVNSDRSITVFRPTVYRAGDWRRLMGWDDTATGVCTLMSRGKEVWLLVEFKNKELKERSTVVGLNGDGSYYNSTVLESGNEAIDYVICRKKTKAEFDAEKEQARREAEYAKEQERRRKAYEAQEAAKYKKCLKERKEDSSIRCIPPRTGGWSPWSL